MSTYDENEDVIEMSADDDIKFEYHEKKIAVKGRSKASSKRPLIIAALLVAVIIIGIVVGLVARKGKANEDTQDAPPSDGMEVDTDESETTAPGATVIKFSSIVANNVAIETFGGTSYWMTISDLESFSFYDDTEDLVLYLTSSPTPVLPSAATEDTDKRNIVGPNDLRFPGFALETYPLKLPADFFPGDYNAVLLSDESEEDGTVFPIVTSEFTVVNAEYNIETPADFVTGDDTTSPEDIDAIDASVESVDGPVNRYLADTDILSKDAVLSNANVPAHALRSLQQARANQLDTLLRPLSGAALDDTTSNQYKAFQWLTTGAGNGIPLNNDEEIQELYIMTLFYYSTGGENWGNQYRFLSTVPNDSNSPNLLCTWNAGRNGGVECSDEGFVRNLRFSDNNLKGSIPSEFKQLRRLRSADLDGNSITGEVSTVLGNFPNRIWVISCQGCEFSGSLPTTGLGVFNNLRNLNLNDTGIEGQLPAELGGLSLLTSLALADNKLDGTIPGAVAALENLRNLELQQNRLVGNLPSFSGNRLMAVNLDENSGLKGNATAIFSSASKTLTRFLCEDCLLGGTIPPTIGLYTNLQWLKLESTGLTGPIPSQLGALTKLQRLEFGDNKLVGTIPTEMASLPALQFVELYKNLLTDPLPQFNGGSLEHIDLSGNVGVSGALVTFLTHFRNSIKALLCEQCQLSGSIPASITQFSSLETLKLDDTQLSGVLPTQLAALPKLASVDFARTRLGGSIPQVIASMTSLVEFDVHNCQFKGPIPNFNGGSIQSIDLDYNAGLSGSLDTIFSVTPKSLIGFQCEYCELNGTIPGVALGSYGNLQVLNLYETGMVGVIPTQIGSLKNLYYLNLGGNALVGEIPEELASLPNLENVSLEGNRLNNKIPLFSNSKDTLKNLNLNDNLGLTASLSTFLSSLSPSLLELECEKCQLGGTIPSDINVLFKDLEVLRLDETGLGGTIPLQIGQLTKLKELDLGDNELRGRIPSQLAALTSLEYLDLGSNVLSGVIPDVSSMLNLTEFDVSSNRLGGGIPDGLASRPLLKTVKLYDNFISGPIPSFTGRLIEEIDLSDNAGLSGQLSLILATITQNIKSFSCEKCLLGGTIPGTALPRLAGLEILKLDETMLEGSIPTELSSLTNLTSINLAENSLFGSIPQSVASLPNLEELDLYGNRLFGAIPSFVNNRNGALKYIDLSDNLALSVDGSKFFTWTPNSIVELYLGGVNVTGSLPITLPKYTALERLYLNDCGLAGFIPSIFGAMPNLRELSLGDNSFMGSIPSQIASLPNLEVLELYDNTLLAGTIPSFLNNKGKLRVLDFEDLSLSGNIGSVFSNIPTSVEEFWCDECKLSGSLDGTRLQQFVNLTIIKIEENLLTGTIPAELGSLKKLERISLGTNQLRGQIPSTLGSLPMLERFEVFENAMTGTVPRFNQKSLEVFDISSNNIQGNLKSILQSLQPQSLQTFKVAENLITGNIPVEVVFYPNLRKFDIDGQKGTLKIEGTVPPNMRYLSNLEEVNLHDSDLMGTFPAEIAKLPKLQELRLHSTDLSGDLTAVCNAGIFPPLMTADCDKLTCPCCSDCISDGVLGGGIGSIIGGGLGIGGGLRG